MNAVILCGGLSTRLGEITKDIPKVLLPIKGKTVFEWQLEKIKELGVGEVVLAAGHLSNVLKKELGDTVNGVRIIYAVEPERLGTGGAIKYAYTFLPRPDEPTLIFNGDILTTIDIKDMCGRLRPHCDGIILGSKVDDAASYGTLVYDEAYHLLEFKEKEGQHEMGIINGGLYLFNASISEQFPEPAAFSIEYEMFPHLKNLDVYVSDRPWIDIGLPERLEWARAHWNGV